MSTITISQFADALQHAEPALIARMKADELLQASGRPYQELVNRGYFMECRRSGARHTDAPILTGKGQIWLARKYPAGTALGAAQ